MKVNMNYFELEAYREALKSTMKKKYGAVLVHRNRIISKGYNSSRVVSSLNPRCILCT